MRLVYSDGAVQIFCVNALAAIQAAVSDWAIANANAFAQRVSQTIVAGAGVEPACQP